MVQLAAPDQAFVRASLLASLASEYAFLGRDEEALDAICSVLPAIERAPGWSNNYVILLSNAVAAYWSCWNGTCATR
jgi:hypothetical protein